MLPVAVGTIKQAIPLDNLALLAKAEPLVVVAVPAVAAAAVDLVKVDHPAVAVVVEPLVVAAVVHHVVLVLPALLDNPVDLDHPEPLVDQVNPDNQDNPEPPETLVLLDKVANPVNPVDPVVIGVNLHLVVLLAVKVVELLLAANTK